METNTRIDIDDDEIDLSEILMLLWHKAWIIAISAAVVGVLGLVVSNFFITKLYESTTGVYILNNDQGGNIAYSDIQLGTQLTKDYVELIKSRTVIEKVISDNALDMTYGQLSKRIDVNSPTDTRIINITVTDEDPTLARFLANAVREEASVHIQNVMNIEAVNVVDEANLPTKPASPSILKWTGIGAAIGIVLSVGIITVFFVLDDTIKTSEDVEKYLGLSTLGLIPIREEEKPDTSKKRNKDSKGAKDRGRRRDENIDYDVVKSDQNELDYEVDREGIIEMGTAQLPDLKDELPEAEASGEENAKH